MQKTTCASLRARMTDTKEYLPNKKKFNIDNINKEKGRKKLIKIKY